MVHINLRHFFPLEGIGLLKTNKRLLHKESNPFATTSLCNVRDSIFQNDA